MKWFLLFGVLPFLSVQESELDRILRQFKQARTSARTDEEYGRSISVAREALREYLRKNPDAPDAAKASWHRVETYLYSMEFPTAIEGFDKFVADNPGNSRVASARLAAAELCMRLERDADARRRLESWKKMHAGDPRLFQVRIFLAALLVFEKKFDEAAAALQRLRDDHEGKPEEWTAAMQLAACHHVAEKNRKAREVLEEVAKGCPDTGLAGTARQYLREYALLGRTLPSKKETDQEGKTLHLGAHAGKVVILYFFTSRIPIAEGEADFLRRTRARFDGKDLVILGVCIDPEKKDFRAFQVAQDISWPLYYDGNGLNGYLARLYAVHGIPSLRVLDRRGRVRFYNVSGRDLRLAVKKLVAESE
jgi:peroxiredoxin/predicted negative regulator of RcsB-dependent stress response